MKIIQKRVYEGRNIYSHKKCIKIDVDLQGYCEIPSNKIPDFNYNLIKILPELKKHRCGIDKEGGFLIRLEEGTYLAHICEHMVIAMQNMLGIDVCYGKAREIKDDKYYIIVEYVYKNTAIELCNLAVDLINALIDKVPINFKMRFEIVKKIFLSEQMGPSTKAICSAAEEYDIPVTELFNSGIYQLGYGSMGRRIEATIGSNTGCIGVDISCDKLLTKNLLMNQNVPVADGNKVFNIIGLLRDAEQIGYPVVLKPQFGSKGKDVVLDIRNESQLLKAYTDLRKKQKDIIVEKYAEGNDYRICLVNYKVVAAALRVKPFVIGNGKDSLKKLIDDLNEDPLRGDDHEKPLTKIKYDKQLEECIGKQKLTLDFIPAKNEKIILRENANLSTGGMAEDCTDSICRENIEYCIRSAKMLGLDICGIDICSKDISVPLDENGGIVMEVNSAPGIRMHHYPSKGQKHNVGKAILDMIYEGKPQSIPIISVTGTNGKTTTVRLISYVLRKMGLNTGITCTDGIFVNDRCIHKGDDSGYESAKTILLNNEIDAAVLETARGGLIRKGLAYNVADVAVITNITNDHLGLDGVNTMEELSFAKALVGEAVKDDGYTVINADDEYSRRVIDRFHSNIIYFSKDFNNDLIQKNIREGKMCVFIKDKDMIVANNNRQYKIISVNDMPISWGGYLQYNIENAMAACASLVAMKIDYCMISKCFKQFECNEYDNCGRFNTYDYNNRKIILDYGHNIAGYQAIMKSLSKIKNNRDIIGVIGIPGDRENEVAERVGEICSKSLDKIIIKEDVDKRGRKRGEIAELLKQSVKKYNSDVYLKVCLDEVEALQYAINISRSNDIIIIFYENFERVRNYMQELINSQEKCKKTL